MSHFNFNPQDKYLLLICSLYCGLKDTRIVHPPAFLFQFHCISVSSVTI